MQEARGLADFMQMLRQYNMPATVQDLVAVHLLERFTGDPGLNVDCDGTIRAYTDLAEQNGVLENVDTILRARSRAGGTPADMLHASVERRLGKVTINGGAAEEDSVVIKPETEKLAVNLLQRDSVRIAVRVPSREIAVAGAYRVSAEITGDRPLRYEMLARLSGGTPQIIRKTAREIRKALRGE